MFRRLEPLRPKLTAAVPRGREWRYELKLDGFRGVLFVGSGRARFTSKTAKPMPRFQALADALARELRVREAIFDGEIVVMGKGVPDFEALFWNRGHAEYAAFDLLWLDGRDLRPLPYWRRKKAIRKLIRASRIGYVEDTDDPRLFDVAAEMDLEGIVAKRRGDPYTPETEWLKIKHREYSQKEGRWELFDRRTR